MEIDSSILGHYFKRVTLDTNIPTAKLTTTPDGMLCRLNMIGHIVTEGVLNKTAFHKFDENLMLDIRDTGRFNKMLGSFKDKLDISVEGVNILMRGVNKTAHFKLASDIENHQEKASETKYDNGMNIPKTFLEEIDKNASNVDADCVELIVKDNVLTGSTAGQEDSVKEEMKVEYKNCKFIIAKDYFKRILDVIDGETVNLSFQDMELYDKNPPLRFVDKTKSDRLSVWVAPFRKDSE